MEYRKVLLGAASLLALTTATTPGSAAPTMPEPSVGQPAASATVRSATLLDVLMRTKGSLSPDLVQSELLDALSNPTQEQILEFPEILQNLAGLGASPETLKIAKETLVELAQASSAVVGEETAGDIVAALNMSPTIVQLAQNRGNRRDPPTTGQVGPGGGGAPGGGYR